MMIFMIRKRHRACKVWSEKGFRDTNKTCSSTLILTTAEYSVLAVSTQYSFTDPLAINNVIV
jgi:hypothetical protein